MIEILSLPYCLVAIWESLFHITFYNIKIKVLIEIFDSAFILMGYGIAAKEVKLGSWGEGELKYILDYPAECVPLQYINCSAECE